MKLENMRSILTVQTETGLVALPLIFIEGEMCLDATQELTVAQRNLGCFLGFHVWDGNRCINCGKTR